MSRNVYFGDQINEINNSYTLDDSISLFRYLDFSKYVELLESQKLCFCNTKYFEDKLEGEMPEAFYYKWIDEHKNGHKSISEEINKHFSSYISCWNIGVDENYALWKIYTHPETGVCIRTTVGNLKKSLNNSDVKIFKIKYIPSFEDSSFDIELPFYFRESVNGMIIPLSHQVKEVCKLDSYEYEHEARAIYVDKSKNNVIRFPINIEELINEVYFSPYPSVWFRNLVKKITNKKRCLSNKVIFRESKIKV